MTDHKLESAAKTVYHEGQDKVEPYVNLTSRGREILGDDDRMFAAEDIIQLIEEQIERHEEEHEEVRECNIDDCPYDRDTDEHLDEELMIVGRKQSLKALKSRICSLEVEER